MIIVGADLATASGLCFGRPDQTPVVKALRAPVTGEDYGLFGAYYWRAFRSVLAPLAADLRPGERILVNLEAPILPRPKWNKAEGRMEGQTQLATTRKLHSLGVLLETVCTLMREDEGVPVDVYECHLTTLKKELAGHGGAAKADMVFVARRAGIVLPPGKDAEDCADGFAAWILAMRLHAREHQPMWDKRIWSTAAGRLM